ncbi:MAG: WD40/YVTN/BNR-like repeat-containing protein [Gammaproteobacteria bacterium]
MNMNFNRDKTGMAARLIACAVLAVVFAQAAPAQDHRSPITAELVRPHFLAGYWLDENRGFATTGLGQIVATDDGGGSWREIYTPDKLGESPLTAIHFGGVDTGVAVGPNSILITSDGGRHWSGVKPPVDASLRSTHMLNDESGFIVGNKKTLLRTDDRGITWKPLPMDGFPSGSNPEFIYFKNELSGAIGTDSHNYVVTKDGGRTWEFPPRVSPGDADSQRQCDKPSNDFVIYRGLGFYFGGAAPSCGPVSASRRLLHAYFFNSQVGYAIESSGEAVYSTDGGKSWDLSGLIFDEPFIAFRDLGDLKAIVLDKSGAVYVTENGGRLWRLKQPPLQANTWLVMGFASERFYSIDFATDQIGVVTGRGFILRTADGGKHWLKVPGVPRQVKLTDVRFLNEKFGIAVGYKEPGKDGTVYGAVLTTGDAGKNWNAAKLDPDIESMDWYRVRFLDDSRVLVFGYEAVILSEDLGKTWKKFEPTDPENSLGYISRDRRLLIGAIKKYGFFSYPGVDFITNKVGVVAGNNKILFRTDDGGANWRRIPLKGLQGVALTGLKMIDSETLIVADEFRILRSEDSGETWTEALIQPAETAEAGGRPMRVDRFDFFDKDNGFTILNGNEMYVTKDGGENWRPGDLPALEGLIVNGLYMLNQHKGYLLTRPHDPYLYLLTPAIVRIRVD